MPSAPVHRQAVVRWKSVPAGIREPVDAYLETTVSVRNPGDWADFVPDDDPEYAELGISFMDAVSEGEGAAKSILETGTHRNLRDAVKRAWHAAVNDPRVQTKPAALSDLFTKPVVAALVASTRTARRERLEAQGRIFDPKVKGRYEHSLVEALCLVGRALAVAHERLEEVEDLKNQIDPHVIGMKRTPDGGFKRVYAERRIGSRHAIMLSAFADTDVPQALVRGALGALEPRLQANSEGEEAKCRSRRPRAISAHCADWAVRCTCATDEPRPSPP
jgi:hypothetical protein